jgi:hypothetical protein
MNLNYTETFDQFASRLSTTDLALYAGAGIIIWVLFKEKLSPVSSYISSLLAKFKNTNNTVNISPVVVPEVSPVAVNKNDKEDTFFKLVVSWKQTRDLAVASGCQEAVKVADQMFPFLSPNVCSKEKVQA